MNAPRMLLRRSNRSALCLALAWFWIAFPAETLAQDSSAGGQEVSVPGAAEPSSPAAWYGAGVRPTEAQTPEEERQGFHLPPGFEVRLFASEPEIAKPMNLAWDAQGRMWVTDSVEYPYPAQVGSEGRDAVRILEDTDGDGRADRTRVFASGLNIPIGVLPYGEGCLCFSIPNIYYLRDTDGDGVCDQRDVVLGPFDTTRDTHGMINAMRMGDDGWVYANHGFNNQSEVAGRDGHKISMQSGNTFRFRPDGSRVEQVTWGQVNPFGRARDDWGTYYVADCHSKPISQLIRGGYYPSFGRPDDGLGFVPPMMDHLHGSTAISGVAYVSPAMGIPALENQLISGNVMTSRLNRNRVEYHGATARAVALPDFLTSDDPWFRPVDVRLGPDGFLYVADFYNKIIGHYEVPLEHPGRDRRRGRIWQIRPPQVAATPPVVVNRERLAAQWNSGNATIRSIALQWAMQHADATIDELAKRVLEADAGARGTQTAFWYLLRRGQLDTETILRLLQTGPAELRVQVQLGMAETLSRVRHPYDGTNAGRAFKSGGDANRDVPAVVREVAKLGLADANPQVRRAAAELAGQFRAPELIEPLLGVWQDAASDDAVLRQTARIALRNQLRDFASAGDSKEDSEAAAKWQAALRGPHASRVAEIVMAVRSELAGELLLETLRSETAQDAATAAKLTHAAVCLRETPSAVAVLEQAKRLAGGDADHQRALLTAIAQPFRSDSPASGGLRDWASSLVAVDLDTVRELAAQQRPASLRWLGADGKSWPRQTRSYPDGRQLSVTSSFPLGEQMTGVLESDAFAAPAEIGFAICGHNGFPDEADHQKNRVELIDAATRQVLRTAYPPRNDALHPVRWDLRGLDGREVVLRIVDGDSAGAYAWLAVGAFEPDWVEPSTEQGPLRRALQWVAAYDLRAFVPQLLEMLDDSQYSMTQKAEIGSVVAGLRGRSLLSMLYASAVAEGWGRPLPEDWRAALGEGVDTDPLELVSQWGQRLNAAAQKQFALRLAAREESARLLLAAVDRGSMSPDVLVDKQVEERLTAISDPEQRALLEALQERATPVDETVRLAMDEALAEWTAGNGNVAMGVGVFTKHCAACHQVGGLGQVVGPQLDGVGGRGAARLMEDIMMPDRNVDKAFRTTTVLTIDGQVLTGLVRSEDDERISLVGNDGKPFDIAKEDVEQRKQGVRSLMPGNFHETLKADELASLVRFLEQSAGQSSR